MLRLLGIPVSDDDVCHLIATLMVESAPDAPVRCCGTHEGR